MKPFFILFLAFPLLLNAEVDYLREVKPLLEHKCFACHGALKQKGGLRLDTAEFIRKGGKSGSALELILDRVNSEDESERMPQEASSLTTDEIAMLSAWIKAGAPAPEGEVAMADPRAHWSYQTPKRSPVPESDFENPIDAFIAAARDSNGIKTIAPAANRSILLRRVYLDLIGIPPTAEQTHAFLADESSEAYDRVVQQLLASPMHGERWGRHWMDVWRYSDWYGRRAQNEIRYGVRHIWRWRDWIVNSINEDKGYDRMVLEMLAGDELAPNDPGALAATGYLGRNWYKFNRNVWLFDTVETTSQALLGLTMRCARCHDHKYDALSQEEYYRFRAFFEPHDVRTDALEFAAKSVKDNNIGTVLTDGLSRVFDKNPDEPTYRFERGDDRRPDESAPLEPGVPSALGGVLAVEPVALPVEAFYPALRPEILASRIANAEEAEAAAKAKIGVAETALAEAESRLKAGAEPGEIKTIWTDDFSKAKEIWKPVGGIWKFEDGVLREEQVANFATILRDEIMPRDFRLRVRYRTLKPGSVRSVGISFDYVDQGHSQDVYTSTGDQKQSVQAFHRVAKKNEYPATGIVPTELSVDAETTLEIEARGQTLKIWLNGEQKHDYVMPLPRREGKFALWVHAGSAEFLEIEAQALPITRETLIDDVQTAEAALIEARIQAEAAKVEVASIEARAAAERARYSRPKPANAAELTRKAAEADAILKQQQAEVDSTRARAQLERVKAANTRFQPTATKDPLVDAEAKVVQADQQLLAAQKAIETPGEVYEPLGEMHPDTSTGRRLALARWIVSPDNPRAARVAVNHMWLRHFGEALVFSVSNFGPAGKDPTHPELLDWLAVELIESGWSMKHLHELMVTSETYRLASFAAPPDGDPQNRFYWRMNPRRMEAEAVRDSILAISGGLDSAMGGPDLDPLKDSNSKRRSLYFRTTPDQQQLMLGLFDAANPNACYRREESITPQQALALANSGLALDQSRLLAAELSGEADFAVAAFERILGRVPNDLELSTIRQFLTTSAQQLPADGPLPGKGDSTVPPSTDPVQRARENLIHVLFSHNDFVTIR
ncbi:MAG: hypothetical protein ACI8UO_002295 [Verrucomicrobiales bacterium]|jgi:hypothetical protein